MRSLRTIQFILLTLLGKRVQSFVVDNPSRARTVAPSATQLFGVGKLVSRLWRGRNPSKTAKIVHETLIGRRTVNNFDPSRTVDPEIVQKAVEAAIYAPCHKMTEPWRFIHLGTQTIEAIAKLNAASIAQKDPAKAKKKQKRWQAIPGWCVVTCVKSPSDAVQEREDYAATACAIQNFMLSLWSQGIGTKWTSGPITRTKEFADLCGIDLTTADVVGCIWYGYAVGEDGLQSMPAPKRRLGLEEVTSYRP